ncbi:TPA: FAD-dependent oxidoreductase [Pseudomonas aeruginosa]|nr:FAD-dependent oxidoreductase [Pseudomonas aeruginosa]
MPSENNNSRRSFIKSAGVLLASSVVANRAIAAGKERVESAKAAPAKPGDHFDVIVIGGGMAGLTAARDCALRGMKTLVLEARNRIGGRTFTSEYGGKHVELGGTWIHWSQGFVWNEVTRYGLAIAETPGAMAETSAWITDGKLKSAPSADLWPMVGKAMADYCNVDGLNGRLVFPRPYDPFMARDKVREWDKLSLLQRLDQMKVSQEVRDLLNVQFTINCHNDPSQGAFIDMLRWWALGDYDMFLLFDKIARYKIAEGTSALAHAIIGDGDAQLLLSTPVKSVASQGGRNVVTSMKGDSFSSDAVICAVPQNVLSSISFTPGLSAIKMKAAQAGHTGRGYKCYIHIKQKIGKWIGMAPYPAPITQIWTEQEREDGTLLVCFGPPGGLDQNDEEQVQQAVRQLIPGAEVVAVLGYEWAVDPYSKGTWCWYRPDMFSESLEALRAPEGSIYFASADSSNGWRGFIDGAIQSGVETAHAVHKKLNGGKA